MGKLSRKKTFDGKTKDDKQQRKISSFFENKPANKQDSSKLFTSITESKKAFSHESSHSNNKISSLSSTSRGGAVRSVDSLTLFNGKEIICVDDDNDTPQKGKEFDIASRDNCVTSVDNEGGRNSKEDEIDEAPNTLLSKSLQNIDNDKYPKCPKDIEQKAKMPLDNITTITPSKEIQDTERASSPDVIYNTPNVDSGGGRMKFKGKQGGRSFLRPFHLVTKQPDLKPAEQRLNPKRKVNKTIGPVSVSFNSSDVTKSNNCFTDKILDSNDIVSSPDSTKPIQNDLGKETAIISLAQKNVGDFGNIHKDAQCDGICIQESQSTDRMTDPNQFVSLLPKSKFCEGSEKNDDKPKSCDEEADAGVGSNRNAKTENEMTSKHTPTKIYHQSDLADLVKVKRMAKSGLSPASKRLSGQLTSMMDIDFDISMDDNGVEKVKRNLNLSTKPEAKIEKTTNDSSSSEAQKDSDVDYNTLYDIPLSPKKAAGSNEAKRSLTSKSYSDFNIELLGIDNSFDGNKNSTPSVPQKTKPSKFTVKKAEALGWKGVMKIESKTTTTLKDDDLLDELMQGLNSSGNNVKSCKSPNRSKKMKSTIAASASSLNFTEHSMSENTSSVLTLPSDDVFLSLGMDLPEETNANFAPASKRNGKLLCDNHEDEDTGVFKSDLAVSNDVVITKKKQGITDEHGLLNCSDSDMLLLAELDDETNGDSGKKQAGHKDLTSSFGALSPFKVPKGRPTSSFKSEFRFSDLWQRFIVKDVTYDSNDDEKHLSLCGESESTPLFFCILQGFWVDTKVCEGDVVNIIGQFDDNNRCTLNDKSGILVVSPDLLLSGTSVVSSVFCARKSVLNEKFKGLDQGNVHMLYGSIIHSLFQNVLKDNLRQEEKIMQMTRTLLAAPKFLHSMYSLKVTEATILEEIKQYIPSLLSWLDKHMALPDKGRVTFPSCDQKFGIKGKIDLTVKAKLQDENGLVHTKTVPLELKTGRASFSSEHKGQVTLYSMMYGDRRGDPGEGLLLYLKTGQMEKVQAKPQSMSGLIQLRNNLASYFKDQVSRQSDETGHMTYSLGHLPRPINNQRACDKCAHLLNCCLYQRSVESAYLLPQSHPMTKLVPETLNHLDLDDLSYFTHWVTCLQMEEQEANRKNMGPIWNMGSMERERKGDCLSHLLIQSSELGIQESQGYNEGKGCSLTFMRHPGYQASPALDSVGLIVNDAVVVSSEDGRLIALATGFIRTLSATHVEVIVDRDNLYDIGVFKNILFRLDHNTSFSTSAQLMANLTRLMENSSHASRLRELIVRKRQPQSEMKIPMAWVRKMKPVFKDLNKPQKTAILKVLMSTDYTLIRGFPGTGKTSTIVALVKVLQLLGKSVLLTSYTHSAVDNILLKLKRDDIPFLRLGRQARIHPSIRPHSAEILTSSIPSVEELKKFYNSYTVIATSCLGVGHTLFNHRRFDICIVDEASQVLQPACLGPLFYCQKFVLVGDSQQLSPVVQSKGARSIGMDQSLFSRLEDRGSTYDLNLQYRMNKVIMAISNKLVYNGRLECGNQDVASQCLTLELSKLEECPDWIKEVFSPELSKSVIFIDTQKACNGNNGEGQSGIHNDMEASIVISLLQTLHKVSVSTGDMGVISPFRSQVKLLQRKVKSCPSMAAVEVNTVDQYQGRDKSVVIVSFALSDDKAGESAGELLKDIRRLNVALTRARHKLILIGNVRTLRAWPHLEHIITDLHTQQCMVQIPSGYIPSQSSPIKI